MLEIFYKQFVDPGDLVFDIGANVGRHSRAFQSLGARIVAVEPDPRCITELQSIHGISVVHAAAGEDGIFGNLRFGHSASASTLSGKWIQSATAVDRFGGFEWTGELPVIQYSLDHLIRLYGIPQFIKIDVEGYEAEVLRGLSIPVKALSFEFHPEFLDAAEDCVARLESLGMKKFNYSLEENFKFNWNWFGGGNLLAELYALEGTKTYGDVYARL
jgi:FkbM family methyltransferase